MLKITFGPYDERQEEERLKRIISESVSQQIHKELKAYENKKQTEALATRKEAETSAQKLIEEETKRAGWINKHFGAKLGLSLIVGFLITLSSAALILSYCKNIDAENTSTLLGTSIVLCGAISWMCEHHGWKSPEKKKLFEEIYSYINVVIIVIAFFALAFGIWSWFPGLFNQAGELEECVRICATACD